MRRFAAIGLLTLLGGCCLYSTPSYRGPRSSHYDGQRFFNPDVDRNPDVRALLRWAFSREPGPWPEPFDAAPGPKPPTRVPHGQLRVTFVNHATVLIQVDGLNILTDPVWSKRIGPSGEGGPGLDRVRPPGIRFEDLPPIDLVLLSHNHYDHTDVPTLARLAQRSTPRVAVSLGMRRFLKSEGIPRVRELDWWDTFQLTESVRLVSVPAQHFSRRGVCDADTSSWSGWVLQTSVGNIFFAGDTGYGPHFAEIRKRLGPTRLAILPIGAYKPEWFMGPIHLSPRDAVAAHRDLGAQQSVGVHFGTFRLADDAYDDPPRELIESLKNEGVPREQFWVLEFGEGRNVPTTLRQLRRSELPGPREKERVARSCAQDLATYAP